MYLLGDIGGTKIRLIFCSSEKDLKKLSKLKIFSTPKDYEDFLKVLKSFIGGIQLEGFDFFKKLKKAVFGFAGMLDKKKEKLIYSPNLKNFEKKNLKKDLERILNCEVILENDAVLGGLGEGRFGSGKNFDVFGYLTLSTGVGGAKIIKKQISINSNNKNLQKFDINYNLFGSEPGHSFLLINNFLFEVEDLLGGDNIRKILGKKPEEIKDKKFWDYYHQILTVFLVNVSIFWSVDKIILGGSLIKKIYLKKINFYLNKFYPLPINVQLKKSVLGDLSGIYGSLVKLRNK